LPNIPEYSAGQAQDALLDLLRQNDPLILETRLLTELDFTDNDYLHFAAINPEFDHSLFDKDGIQLTHRDLQALPAEAAENEPSTSVEANISIPLLFPTFLLPEDSTSHSLTASSSTSAAASSSSKHPSLCPE
jgi:hypothetical protein